MSKDSLPAILIYSYHTILPTSTYVSTTSLYERSYEPTYNNMHVKGKASLPANLVYIISMLNKAKLDPGIQRQERHSILTMSSDLYRLRGLQTRYYYQEMRMFLTGGGGSGKTHVIKQQVLIYCKAFCQECNVPFHKRTITVTALTGVAAIALNGETLHKGCGINVDLSISKVWLYSDQEIQMWKDCCLLIIDEISFATRGILQTLDRSLRLVRDEPKLKYGGVSVLYCGDVQKGIHSRQCRCCSP